MRKIEVTIKFDYYTLQGGICSVDKLQANIDEHTDLISLVSSLAHSSNICVSVPKVLAVEVEEK